MVLAKGDLSIAAMFSRMAGPLHDEFFPLIERELALTKKWVLRLNDNEWLTRSDSGNAPRSAKPGSASRA